MAKIILENISMKYKDQFALKDFNLTVEEGEFIVVVGPSGSGKSTLLRLIAGLEKPTSGIVRINNHENNAISMVFQNYRLFNHMTIYDNIAFGIKKHLNLQKEQSEILFLSKQLGIDHLLQHYPHQLSGGEKQRVGIARAIISRPEIVLMDEPLSNLDASLKTQLKQLIQSLHKQLQITFIYVTHDQNEAMTLGNRMVVLNNGITQQIASPHDIYHYPSNQFVAKFIGIPSMNFIKVNKQSQLYPMILQENIIVGIRPEAIQIALSGIQCKVSYIENFGTESYVYTHIDDTEIVIKTTQTVSSDFIHINFEKSALYFFDAKTKERIKAS